MHRSVLSYIAMVVEVLPDRTVFAPKATVAVDADFVANPDQLPVAREAAGVDAQRTLRLRFLRAHGAGAILPQPRHTRRRPEVHRVDAITTLMNLCRRHIALTQ